MARLRDKIKGLTLGTATAGLAYGASKRAIVPVLFGGGEESASNDHGTGGGSGSQPSEGLPSAEEARQKWNGGVDKVFGEVVRFLSTRGL